jgi:hypothetical protein
MPSPPAAEPALALAARPAVSAGMGMTSAVLAIVSLAPVRPASKSVRMEFAIAQSPVLGQHSVAAAVQVGTAAARQPTVVPAIATRVIATRTLAARVLTARAGLYLLVTRHVRARSSALAVARVAIAVVPRTTAAQATATLVLVPVAPKHLRRRPQPQRAQPSALPTTTKPTRTTIKPRSLSNVASLITVQ